MARLCGRLKQERDPWEKEQQVREHRVEEAAGAPEDACSGCGWRGGDLVTLGRIQVLHSHVAPRVLGGMDRGHVIADVLWDGAGLNVDMSTPLPGVRVRGITRVKHGYRL